MCMQIYRNWIRDVENIFAGLKDILLTTNMSSGATQSNNLLKAVSILELNIPLTVKNKD